MEKIEEMKQCPICEQYSEAFESYRNRLNAKCPNCKSMERHRLMFLYLKNETNLFSRQAKMLHVAPEPKLADIFSKLSNIDYLSADLNSKEAIVKMDLQDIDYSDDTFDVIYCSHVLEHIPDDRKALRELYRVLKPEGWCILQVPMLKGLKRTIEAPEIDTPTLRKRFYGQEDHLRVYGLDYIERLEQAGFKVKVDKYFDSMDYVTIGKFGLRKEDTYFCTK